MASPTGFIEFNRVNPGYRPVKERVKDFRELEIPLTPDALKQQTARCMDCGVPFCHATGCPLYNRIPEFNELVYLGRWKEASDNLHSTNNFPEITGRVCPAPCEAACTLNLQQKPVTIRHIECQIVEHAFQNGWVRKVLPRHKTGRRVAVVGSGPAGLAAAQQLTRAGHEVVLFEKDDRIGGLLRYGIPDFKLEKHIIDRRVEQMVSEGVKFETNVCVGGDISPRYLKQRFDAVCLCVGAGRPRALTCPGADLAGVHYAMEFLAQQNRRVAGDNIRREDAISARGKHVVVIGGGDTGSDCVGTSIRQGARSVHQLEILPKPPEGLNPETPWPYWPRIMRTSSSHEEGCVRRWSVLTKSLGGTGGTVAELHACEVDWGNGPQGWQMTERSGSEFALKADLVLIAMGFIHPHYEGIIESLELELDPRGNIRTTGYVTNVEGIYAAGDAARGASLVVHAIHAGRQAAAEIDRWLVARGN